MSADLQLWNNWITGAGVVVNAALTAAIIYLTNNTASENKRSADAAEKSAKSANDTYEITKEMIERQKSMEQRVWEGYRRYYGKKIVEYSIYCNSALLNAFNVYPENRNYSMLKAENPPDFQQDQLFIYFETNEIDRLFNAIRDYAKLRQDFIANNDYGKFDWNRASSIVVTYLLSEFQEFARIFDVR